MTPFRVFLVAAALATGAARAETVSGTFFFLNPRSLSPTPVVDCEVHVLVDKLLVATTRTNGAGAFSVFVNLPNVPVLNSHPPMAFEVKVFAHNRAAVVHTAIGGTPVGPHFFATGTSWSSNNNATVTFGPTTFGDWSSRHFHIADAVRVARNYADARRDRRETDSIPEVRVVPNQLTGDLAPTFWNAPANQLELSADFHFSGPTIAHEYAHFLEDKIGGFFPLPTRHDGCFARDLATGALLNSPEHAWMEGFADYFAGAVATTTGALQGGFVNSGTSLQSTLETPNACGAIGQRNALGALIAADAVENVVGATLTDVFDPDSRSSASSEAFDWVQRFDREVFEIFDHELDHPSPTLLEFHDAWVRRGFDDGALDQIMARLGVDRAALEGSHARAARERGQVLASTPAGEPSVFAVSTAARVARADQLAGGFGAWGELGALEGVPAAITTSNGVSHHFWRTQNNTLAWSRRFSSGMSAIEVLGGYLGSSPSVASFPDGRLIVCARSADLQLVCAEQNTAGTFVWSSLGGSLRSQPVLAHDGLSRLEVHALRADDVTTMRAQVGGAWQPWQDTGGIGTSLLTAVPSAGHIELLVRGTDGALWRNRSTNGALAGWSPLGALGQRIATAPDAAFDDWGGLQIFAGLEPNAVPNRLWLSANSLAGAFQEFLPSRTAAASALHVRRNGPFVRASFRDSSGRVHVVDVQGFAATDATLPQIVLRQ